ncbi:MAG: hypothetical protein Q9162_002824 [Coniocarpon cinnabarinum]
MANPSGTIPTTTHVTESALIPAPFSSVWHLLKLQDFGTWYSALAKTEYNKGTSPETDVIRWHFKDGTVQDIKQEEHSSLNHYITYSVITSAPALSYTSVVSTIRCWNVTTGPAAGGTFVECAANFSSDADAGVIQDAKYKRREMLEDLAKAAQGKGVGKTT